MEKSILKEKFGALNRVDLRLLWPREALDFTRWLAQNLAGLGEVLGVDFELQKKASVGSSSLDLLVHDMGCEWTVIIENQIETTDHDHLGKLLTYAADHDAAVVVRIAADFREEHRQALDWLNQRSASTGEFFGIVVEALQTGDSRPASDFRLVAYPNDWRNAHVPAGSSNASPRSESYQAFFQDLIDRLRTKHNFTKAREAQPRGWYAFSSGVRSMVYAVSFGIGGRVRTEAYIDCEDVTWNKWMFDVLYQRRGEIEAALDEPLEWERLDHKRASCIAIYRPGSIDDIPQTLVEIKVWGIERLL